MTRSKMIVTLGMIALISVAFMGCSDDSNPTATTTTPVDTAPPAVPSNLTANFDGSVAVVSWAANTTDSDLAGYLVQKSHYDDAVVTLVGVPSMVTSIQDDNVQAGLSQYQILAVDEAGNESAYATIQVVNSDGKSDYSFDN